MLRFVCPRGTNISHTQARGGVTGSVLTNDEPGYFKDVSNGKILEDDIESREGFEEEQEIVKDLASKIYIPKA